MMISNNGENCYSYSVIINGQYEESVAPVLQVEKVYVENHYSKSKLLSKLEY